MENIDITGVRRSWCPKHQNPDPNCQNQQRQNSSDSLGVKFTQGRVPKTAGIPPDHPSDEKTRNQEESVDAVSSISLEMIPSPSQTRIGGAQEKKVSVDRQDAENG